MATIYLDPSAVAGSDSPDRLAHLVEAGHDLVLVTADDGAARSGAIPARIPARSRIPALPDAPARGSWFVTADPATCGDRRPALRTILIGPRAATPGPTRCDSTARDLRDAILEILAADAMD
ncbi:MAG TPA: hypothetical protein VM427_01770 [Patescibacteria group bacterium]|nr:hypothetical protein [Patescibacteria group bacterium]